jgi:oligosaccharide repeat unit polymerase
MNFIYLILSFFLFLFAPTHYSLAFCNAVTVIFLFQTVFFLIKKSKGNYVNFYTIFYFSYFFINFFYPSVLYPIDPEYFSVFKYIFNIDYINKGTALALLASSSFIFGVNIVKASNNKNSHLKVTNTSYYEHKVPTITTIILFLLFIITVGGNFLAGDFTAHSTISLYILQLLQCSFILSSIIFFKYYRFQKFKKLFYYTALAYILIFLSIGDRGPGMSLILISIGLYNFYVKNIKLKYLVPVAICGVLIMHFIGLGRTTDYLSAEGNIIRRGLEKSESESIIESVYNATESFVVNTRNLYVGIEYVDNYGHNWGETMYISFLAVIPFGQTFFSTITGVNPKGSASFFTELVFGKEPPYGLGTNLIADVYISFGLFGVVFLFILFGYFVQSFQYKTISNRSFFSVLTYFSLLYFSVSFPRDGLFMPLKFIIWTYVIYYLLRKLRFLKPKLLFEQK